MVAKVSIEQKTGTFNQELVTRKVVIELMRTIRRALTVISTTFTASREDSQKAQRNPKLVSGSARLKLKTKI